MSDLDDAFAKAAEIAKKVPRNLQDAAFNRALDALLVTIVDRQARRLTRTDQSRTREQQIELPNLLNKIDRTKYPDIGQTTRVADRALKVLRLAREDHNVDGLSASQIADILTHKFRLPTKVTAARMALSRESTTVDTQSAPDGSQIFRIMEPGEAYLDQLRSGQKSSPKHETKKPTSRRLPQKERSKLESKDPKISKKITKASGRPGPKAAVVNLVAAGFFKSPQTISSIRENLKHKRGNTYSLQELSPALVRCVRDEILTRERNTAGQYEYSQA